MNGVVVGLMNRVWKTGPSVFGPSLRPDHLAMDRNEECYTMPEMYWIGLFYVSSSHSGSVCNFPLECGDALPARRVATLGRHRHGDREATVGHLTVAQ